MYVFPILQLIYPSENLEVRYEFFSIFFSRVLIWQIITKDFRKKKIILKNWDKEVKLRLGCKSIKERRFYILSANANLSGAAGIVLCMMVDEKRESQSVSCVTLETSTAYDEHQSHRGEVRKRHDSN